jgi:hypothetical protein
VYKKKEKTKVQELINSIAHTVRQQNIPEEIRSIKVQELINNSLNTLLSLI